MSQFIRALGSLALGVWVDNQVAMQGEASGLVTAATGGVPGQEEMIKELGASALLASYGQEMSQLAPGPTANNIEVEGSIAALIVALF